MSRLARLEAAVERQSEQVGRLEDLVRELVLTAESLRRELARADASATQPRGEAPQQSGEQA